MGYPDSVPAVTRAVRALEHLASASQPLSLTTLSRALVVSPSSLLAILTTLRSLGLVTRSTRDGRYLPGPGLVALGTAAAQALEPLHAFDLLATELVEQLGETVLLWIQQGDGLAMAHRGEGGVPMARSRARHRQQRLPPPLARPLAVPLAKLARCA